MKAYLFNTKTGIYEDENFANAEMLQLEEGITAVPHPDYGPGQVVVFERERQVLILS